ncbi:MAG: rod shape-determining protein MreD [Deltaproteobacteria bacterium RIFCSPLOWO2_02_FULL_50_16]|nr:MAG: rod shape-determining protein MreD [Deltaproteobacteria bacterium GWA2_50_8]OGQ25711.1 MAG: rod shape-determining protein MreD [Deltaproteobacteria bacterium RIFCSPHIGHO2_02_FULL_50_15]OGQ56974.1 MAG: rod shape-determining protein MreD [Deltaproteobacteria bacterium RIFCSPLOWO2_02_FULL_50_16]OGQ68052.1 MAG: rod shape-determining protein MreD [Deltaproteobacteria bacterium RIFCSPLOWO2_12_FULL_50_11]
MKRLYFFIVLGLVSLVVETTFLRTFPTWNIRCDLIWLSVLFIGFYHELWEGLPSVLILGLMTDCIASPFLGLLTADYLCVFFILRLLTAQIYVEALLSKIFWVFIMTILGKYIEYLLLHWIDIPISLQPTYVIYIIIQGVWNGLLAVLFFPFLKRAISRIYKRDYAHSVSSRQYS